MNPYRCSWRTLQYGARYEQGRHSLLSSATSDQFVKEVFKLPTSEPDLLLGLGLVALAVLVLVFTATSFLLGHAMLLAIYDETNS